MSEGKNYDIFSGSKFVESIRSSGYQDTSYAVAELVDNSIDAKANHVQIICVEKLNSSQRYSLEKIAVLDNGTGMDVMKLRSSLLFGDGTRGGDNDIGKYGMGLPNSSFSQCKRVEVYSWQNSNRPSFSYLDYDEIEGGKRSVPIPEERDMPQEFTDFAKTIQKSGTLVVWSKLDRCSWTRGRTLMNHSEFIIGRIYRKFLHDKRIKIDMVKLKVDNNERILDSESVSMLPNDPMYLMAPSSTPGKWGKEPMFKPDTIPEDNFPIPFDGNTHNIIVRYSIEKDELRSPDLVQGNQGNTDHGRHARKNMGVSIIRADREITLDTTLVSTSDPRERWWGVEIDIPTSLDILVGLTNNKQHVDTLSAIMHKVAKFGEDDSDERELTDELEEDEAAVELLRMVTEVNSRMRSMAKRIRMTRKGTLKKSGEKTTLEKKIESGILQEEEEGRKGQTDKDRETLSKEERKQLISDDLKDGGYNKEEADKEADQWVENDRKIIFQEGELDGSNFFTVKNIGGILQIKINRNHRAYKNLLSLTNAEEYNEMNCDDKLKIIHDGLWLLLASWARFEDLVNNDQRRKDVQDTRYDWGKELDLFLEKNIN